MDFVPTEPHFGPLPRRMSVGVRIGEGRAAVTVGGGAPIVVQSMTNTDTADVEATVSQIAALARAGSELVRLTVDRDEAAAAVPHIRDRLRAMGVDVPLIGDFHYIGHKLLAEHPACAEALDKYRINPGNVGFKNKRDLQFGQIVETAIRNGKAVRIGANWGSLDQELLTSLMDENARARRPCRPRAVTREAMVRSALLSAARAEEIGLDALAHHPVGQSLGRPGPDHGLSHAGPTVGLRAASRPHRGRHGHQRDRRLRGRARRPVAGRRRRHDPHFADAGARRRPDAGGSGRAGTLADDGLPHLRAAGRRLPRLRAHDLDGVPGAGARHSEPSSPPPCPSGARSTRAWSASTSR